MKRDHQGGENPHHPMLIISWTITDSNGSLDITNYIGAQTATIYKELGKIRTATTRMIHIIDLNHI